MTLSLQLETLQEVPPTPDNTLSNDEADSKEMPVCANCRSSEISFFATAGWNNKEQCFEYDIFGDKVLCSHCHGKQHVEWITV